MRPIVVSIGPSLNSSANSIALSQTPSGAGNLTLNGALVTSGVATLATPQRVLITTSDSTHKFTITGTTPTGSLLTEVVTSNGTNVLSTLDYATVTSVAINGAASGAVTVGTNGTGSTPWARMDEWANTQVSIQVNVTGTVNWTLQSSMDDPNSNTNPVSPSAMTWINTNDTNAVGQTGAVQTNYLFSPTWVRVLLNSGSGSVTATIAQANVANL